VDTDQPTPLQEAAWIAATSCWSLCQPIRQCGSVCWGHAWIKRWTWGTVQSHHQGAIHTHTWCWSILVWEHREWVSLF